MNRKTYTYDDVYRASLEYFNNDELASKVFVDKYALKKQNENGEWVYFEKNPVDMHWRLTKEFHRIESKYKNPMSEQEIFDLFDRFKYVVPQGSPMSVIGNPFVVSSISNCVVLPSPFDSYGGICYTDQQIVQMSKRRCGIGFDISKIRPRGMGVLNSALTTDGVGVFMERFSNSIREVAQSGRRGAQMLTISVHHPEVLNFATIKNNLGKVTGANISIFLTDEFLEAVKSGKKYEQRWPVDSKSPQYSKMIDAKMVWNEIIKNAWKMAEPGLMFIDKIKEYTPPNSYDGWSPISSNPCSEITMNEDTCRLIAINMASFVENPFTKDAKFNFEKWENVVYRSQRLMDDMVDLEIECMEKIIKKIEKDPEPIHIKQIEIDTWNLYLKHAKDGRRTGLGVTGVGDTIAYLNLRYGSAESIELVEKIFKQKKFSEYKSSIDMAEQRGAFGIYDFDKEKSNAFIVQLFKDFPELKEQMRTGGRRNIAISTIAPTGSLSILTQTTNGIEPVFQTSYKRRKKITSNDQDTRVDFTDSLGDKWQEFTVYHHGVKKWMDATGESDISKSPYNNSTSYDLNYKERVLIQAAAQRHIDHSISSTVNLPNNATVEDVATVYTTAWENNLKGVTVYRDGCRDGVLITNESLETKSAAKSGDRNAIKRPTKIPCDIYQITADGEKWTVMVGMVDNKPYEIFCGKPKKVELGKIEKGYIEKEGKGVYSLHIGDDTILKDISDIFNDTQGAITRLISTSLRHGVDIQFIVQQLEKSDGVITSFNKAVSRVLKKYIKDGVKENGAKCPECKGDSLVRQEGCVTCKNCGYSKC